MCVFVCAIVCCVAVAKEPKTNREEKTSQQKKAKQKRNRKNREETNEKTKRMYVRIAN